MYWAWTVTPVSPHSTVGSACVPSGSRVPFPFMSGEDVAGQAERLCGRRPVRAVADAPRLGPRRWRRTGGRRGDPSRSARSDVTFRHSESGATVMAVAAATDRRPAAARSRTGSSTGIQRERVKGHLTRFITVRLPLEMQWLDLTELGCRQTVIAFHYRKAAKCARARCAAVRSRHEGMGNRSETPDVRTGRTTPWPVANPPPAGQNNPHARPSRRPLMGLLDKIRGEFIDIIEWTEPSNNDILAYRFPRYKNEIKNGAKLTVREGQAAVFVNEGQLADVFTPGMYTLETKNLPDPVAPSWGGSTGSSRRSRPRSTSSPRGSGPTRSGARRTRSCCATRSSARCGCGRSAPTPSRSPTRPRSCGSSSPPTRPSRRTRSPTSSAT